MMDEELCEEYELDPDDKDELADARMLVSACSLTAYEEFYDLTELSILKERIDGAYLRAVGKGHQPLIGLAERAVCYLARMEKMLKGFLEYASEGTEPFDDDPETKVQAFLERVARGAYRPDAVVMGLVQAVMLHTRRDRQVEPFESERICDAVANYFQGMSHWSQGFAHDVVEHGYEAALRKQFAPLFIDPRVADFLRFMAEGERHRLAEFIQSRKNDRGPFLTTDEPGCYW